MFGFWIGRWNLCGRHIGWAAIRPGDAEDDFEVLRFWPVAR